MYCRRIRHGKHKVDRRSGTRIIAVVGGGGIEHYGLHVAFDSRLDNRVRSLVAGIGGRIARNEDDIVAGYGG